jgi:hypothetical protein
MQDLFLHLSDTYIKVSHGFVETLIQTQREELFTGVMRLHYLSGETLLMTFLSGSQQNLYRCNENSTEVIPRQSWTEVLDHPDASVAFLSFPEDTLRFVRVICESPILEVEKATYSKQELSERVKNWAVTDSPVIIHVQAGDINRFYLIAGHSTPIIEELSLTGEEAHFSICDASFPMNLALPEFQVTRYVSDGEHDVWQEFELRFAFNPLMRMMLIRFSELAGRLLTDRLCEQLSQSARDGRMHIGITINGITNHHYYNSIEEATRMYFEIVRRFREEASTAIGMRMVDGLAHDTLIKLDPHRRELLKRHIYDRYGSDNLLGPGWR